MKNFKSLSILSLLFVFALTLSPQSAFAKKVYGVFRVVKGKVEVISYKKKGKKLRAKIGLKVYPKDTIITGKDSRVKIVMVDDNVINISPNSKVEIKKYEYSPKKSKKNVLLGVIYGKVRSKVNQKYDGKKNKFQVKTPSAVAGVRGTDFLASYNSAQNATQIVTFEGQVAFGLPGANGAIINPVKINVGQVASSIAGKVPTPPKTLPTKEFNKLEIQSDADKAPNTSSNDPSIEENKEDKKKAKKDKKEKKKQARKEKQEKKKQAQKEKQEKRKDARKEKQEKRKQARKERRENRQKQEPKGEADTQDVAGSSDAPPGERPDSDLENGETPQEGGDPNKVGQNKGEAGPGPDEAKNGPQRDVANTGDGNGELTRGETGPTAGPPSPQNDGEQQGLNPEAKSDGGFAGPGGTSPPGGEASFGSDSGGARMPASMMPPGGDMMLDTDLPDTAVIDSVHFMPPLMPIYQDIPHYEHIRDESYNEFIGDKTRTRIILNNQ